MLILARRLDWICPVEFAEEISRLMPGSDLRVFEGSSHSIRSDEPEALVDAILGFLVYRRPWVSPVSA
jgi:proline iminopeptidase